MSEDNNGHSGAAVASSSEERTTPSLRQRKKGEKSRRHLSFRVTERSEQPEPSEAHEAVFLNMYLRKVQRRVRGRRSNDSLCCEFVVVLVLLAVIIVLGRDDDPEPDTHYERADTEGLIIFWFWLIFTGLIFFYFGRESPYLKMLRVMAIYIPLVFLTASLAFYEEVREEINLVHWNRLLPQQHVFFVLLIITEALTFAGFMSYYKLYPLVMGSKWFRSKPGRIARMWRMGIATDDEWTMRYMGHNPTHGLRRCTMNFTCKYEGDIDQSTGLPDGMGRWLDDAWEGEMLTGYWKQGEPVAPFSSWNVGSNDAVVAVRVAYFKATDDPYKKNKFFPTNDNTPECGVASVECSVSGSFYRHLPHATLIEGPFVADSMPSQDNNPIRECLGLLYQVGEATDNADHCYEGDRGVSCVNIRATDPRGVQVMGHVYEPTGQFYSPDTKSITVDVEWGSPGGEGTGSCVRRQHDGSLVTRSSVRVLQKTLFMPKANSASLSKIVEIEVDDSSDEENENANWQKHTQQMKATTATLRVQNWVPYLYKEALVFFPGYNSAMKTALQNLGQFLAMTKLCAHVYPFVYVWPGSVGPGYFEASKISATEVNKQNVLKFVKGLSEAGITRVHLMTHSMGVKTLLGAFKDEYDENGKRIGRSEVSKCFQLDPDYEDEDDTERSESTNQLICKSITMLNPDFPVRAFIDRGFLSIRRICRTVTIVGDQNDRALWWSSLFNATVPSCYYEFPEVERPVVSPNEERKTELVERIGRSIETLCFPAEVAQQYHESGNEKAFRRQLFNKAASIDLSGRSKEQFWLDLDVIDMTGLDTNIKGMRHSGFSLNGMLLKDLEELLSSGRRAMKRSTLLYREGNVFSYAHAPAFVSQ